MEGSCSRLPIRSPVPKNFERLLKIQLLSPLVKGRSKPLRNSDERGGAGDCLPPMRKTGGRREERNGCGACREGGGGRGRREGGAGGDGAAGDGDGGVRAPTRTMEAGDEEPVGEAGRRRRQER
jgi:hypothetical protein